MWFEPGNRIALDASTVQVGRFPARLSVLFRVSAALDKLTKIGYHIGEGTLDSCVSLCARREPVFAGRDVPP